MSSTRPRALPAVALAVLLLLAGACASPADPSPSAPRPRPLAYVRLQAGPPAPLGEIMDLQLTIVPAVDAPNTQVFFSLPTGIVPIAGRTQQWVDLERGLPLTFPLRVLLLDPGPQSVVAGAMAAAGPDGAESAALDRLSLDVAPAGTSIRGEDGAIIPLAPPLDADALPWLTPFAPRASAPLLRCIGGTLPGASGVAVRCSVGDAPDDQVLVRLSAWLLGPQGVIAKVDPLCSASLRAGGGVCSRDIHIAASSWNGRAVVAGILLPSNQRFGPAVVLAEIEP